MQFPDRNGVLPGYGSQRPNDWGLGLNPRRKNPALDGFSHFRRTYGHFGQSGTFLWVDPEIAVATIALSDENFGDWARTAWPKFSDSVIAETHNTQ